MSNFKSLILGVVLMSTAPILAINHIGTRIVFSDQSQFEGHFINPNVQRVISKSGNRMVQFDFVSLNNNGFGPSPQPVYISEITYRLPNQSTWPLNDLSDWLIEQNYLQLPVRLSCVFHFEKVVNGTVTWILYWNIGKGIHIAFPDNQEMRTTLSQFVSSLNLTGDEACQN